MAQPVTKTLDAEAYSAVSSEQDLLPMLEQFEIQDLGELSLVAWRVI
jgi:hypothetical protein